MSATAREALLPAHMSAPEQSGRLHPLGRIARHVSVVRVRRLGGAAAMRARLADKTQGRKEDRRAYFQHSALLIAIESRPEGARLKPNDYSGAINRPIVSPKSKHRPKGNTEP
jgi:hypothetical protein